ncbi:MAG: hypothetical protein ACFFDI_01035 [Promethearchaeota archaeon]
MNKKHLFEFDNVPAEFEVLEESDGVLKLGVKWQHADIINGNNRLYRRPTLEREILRIQKDLKIGKIFACAYHPKSGSAEVPDVAAIWREAKIERDGSCTGVIEFVGTQAGKDAMAIYKSGGKLGISSRGYGTTSQKVENGKAYQEVNDDFILKSPGDIVLSPSVPDAGVKEMIEQMGDNFEFTEEELKNRKITLKDLKEQHPEILEQHRKEIEEEIERELRQEYENAVYSGYQGTIKDFRKLKQNQLDEAERKDLEIRYGKACDAGFMGTFMDFVKLVKSKK